MPLSYPDVVWCREAADRLPQPIAYSMGRIARAPRDVEPLDWVVRTVETIARYAGLVGAASFAARADPTVPAPWRKKRFKQGLSLNSFFSVAQDAANTAVDHPLRAVLNAALGSEEEAPATTAFGRAMEFRNRNAHGLQGMSEAKARSLLGEMVDYLRTIVSALQPLLDLPLIVIDQQIHQRGSIIARILPLVGEREPFPIDVELDRAAHESGQPYLVVGDELLLLAPGIGWDLVDSTSFVQQVLLLDAATAPAKYRTATADHVVESESAPVARRNG